MKKLYLLLAVSMIMGFAIGQQKVIRCYSNEHLQDQIRQDPERGKRLEALDKRVDDIIAAQVGTAAKGKPGGGTPRTNIVFIPVVVNVVYNSASQNISDAQVQSQIDVINKDFMAKNIEILNSSSYNFAGYDNLVANCKIQFCLYSVVRKQTSVTSFTTNDGVKKTSAGGQDPLNPTTMLNIWSCNIGSGILGYAQFPGGPVNTDGVVILYSTFGTSAAGATADPYDEGRTATHEIGHWLGLYHVFQGGCNRRNDLVTDTPPHDEPNFGCPDQGLVSNCQKPTLEQYMNYMDYVDDLCMYMFTQGQLARIDGYIAASRAPYCLAACPAGARMGITSNLKPVRTAPALSVQQLLVYPTVTQDLANVVIPSKSRGAGDITLFSPSGSILKRKRVALTVGNNYIRLQVGDLPNGLYLIKVKSADGKMETRKLVIQH